MCNLSQKEGSSLFAVLSERQRKTLHLHAEQLISFRPLDVQFRKQPHRLNKKRVHGAKTEPCRWRWPRDCRSLQAELSAWETMPRAQNVTWETPPQRSMLYALCSSGFSEGPLSGCCLACFSFIQGQDRFYKPIHLELKRHSAALMGLNATSLAEERKTLNKGRRMLRV